MVHACHCVNTRNNAIENELNQSITVLCQMSLSTLRISHRDREGRGGISPNAKIAFILNYSTLHVQD